MFNQVVFEKGLGNGRDSILPVCTDRLRSDENCGLGADCKIGNEFCHLEENHCTVGWRHCGSPVPLGMPDTVHRKLSVQIF